MKKLLALLLGLGLPPAVALAFDLIEFEFDVVIEEPVYV